MKEASDTGAVKGAQSRQRSILLVAATHNFRSTVSRILSRCGYSIHTVGAAEEALRQLSKESYDLVVTESHLPGMSGLNLLFQMRDQGCAMPVVLVAESVTERFRWIVSGMGEVHCLRSPVDFDNLKGLLASCLSRTQRTAANGQLRRKPSGSGQ